MKIIAPLLLALTGLSLAAPAGAQFAKPEDAVKYRQGAFFVMAQHFSRLGAMVNGRVPYDAKVAVENADVVADMARLTLAGFGAGNDKISQSAKPEIWSEQVKFREHNEKFVNETGKLLAAAKTNNLDNLKAAFGSTVAVCKSCHDAYRK